MHINLIGPPCSGKTTLARMFCKKHPEWAHLSIDDFRIVYRDELEAWFRLGEAAESTYPSIIETSGASRLLGAFVIDSPTVQSRGVLTIQLETDVTVLLERLKTREKPEVPFEYENLTQEDLIKNYPQLITGKWPLAHHIGTNSGRLPPESTFSNFEQRVLQQLEELEKAKQNAASI